MKRKFQPAAWILRSRANPSSPRTTLHLPEQESHSSPRNFVISGRSSIRMVPILRVGVINPPQEYRSRLSKRSHHEQQQDASIKVQKVNNTISMSRSGFISSFERMCFSRQLANTCQGEPLAREIGRPSGLAENCSLEPYNKFHPLPR